MNSLPEISAPTLYAIASPSAVAEAHGYPMPRGLNDAGPAHITVALARTAYGRPLSMWKPMAPTTRSSGLMRLVIITRSSSSTPLATAFFLSASPESTTSMERVTVPGWSGL